MKYLKLPGSSTSADTSLPRSGLRTGRGLY